MITGFRAESGTAYVYDSVTNQIVRHGGAPVPDDGTCRPDLEAALAGLGIGPRSVTPLDLTLPAEVRASLERGWKRLNLCVSEDCNNRCTYCLHSGLYPYERKHRARSMSLETARKAVDLYLGHAGGTEARAVVLFGGEPLLNWSLVVDVVERLEASAPGAQVQICTNGQLLDETRLAYVVEHGVSLSISLDGPQGAHDAWRVTADGRGTWARVTAVLERLHTLHPRYFESKVQLAATVAPPYDLPATGAFFAAHHTLGCRVIRVAELEPHDNTLLDHLTPEERESTEATRRAHADRLRRNYVSAAREGRALGHFGGYFYEPTLRAIHNRTMFPGPTRGLLGACVPGVEQVFVSVDGRLYPCQTCGSADFMPVGSLEEGLDVEAVLGHVEAFRAWCQEKCGHCWACRFCKHCYISHRKGNRLDEERAQTACEATRQQLRSCLEIYVSVRETRPDAFDFLER